MITIQKIKFRLWAWKRILQIKLGLNYDNLTEDRLLQESLIESAVASVQEPDILYVGVAYYNVNYYKKYFKNTNLITLDINRDQAIFGSSKHIVGGLDAHELKKYKKFDLIFLFGLVGYGVNNVNDLDVIIKHIGSLLKNDGVSYLTLEESFESTLNEKTLIDLCSVHAMDVASLSDWIQMEGKNCKMKFYIIKRHIEESVFL